MEGPILGLERRIEVFELDLIFEGLETVFRLRRSNALCTSARERAPISTMNKLYPFELFVKPPRCKSELVVELRYCPSFYIF